jgi:hypothetical protein
LGAIYRQTELFATKIPTAGLRAGSLRVKAAVHEAIKRALADCELSREQVADELARLTGEEISLHSLNNCCAEGKSNRRFPLEWAKALTLITGSRGILEAALGPEFAALDERGQACREYGELVLKDKLRSRRKRELQERIMGEIFE